ncbi:DUF559 domain-containing protein (plasmid) [Coraliomargarita sp. W4R53]
MTDDAGSRAYATRSYQALRAAGLTRTQIRAAVAAGKLVRARKNVYLERGCLSDAMTAAVVGGRVGCTTALASWGIFVLESSHVHVHVTRHASRLRRTPDKQPPKVKLHWRPFVEEPPLDDIRVTIVDALIVATTCQSPRAAVASLDSALHLGLIDEANLAEIFRHVPARRQGLKHLVDARAESGPETFLRLILRALGLSFECQVEIDGVGRVDFVVEGWLVIECDSRAHHGGWEAQVRDRERDLTLAGLGYTSIRPWADLIFRHSDRVSMAISGLVAQHLQSAR